MYTAPKETAQSFDHLVSYAAEGIKAAAVVAAKIAGCPAEIMISAGSVAFHFPTELGAYRFAFHYSKTPGVSVNNTASSWYVCFDDEMM